MTPVPWGPAPAWEGTDGVEEAAVLLPSLGYPGALRRGHGGPQATVEEEWDIEPLRREESDFELKDLGRRGRHLEGRGAPVGRVEEEETLVDEESEQEGAAVVAGGVWTPWSSLCLCSGLWSTPFYTVSPTMTMADPGSWPCPMVRHSSWPPQALQSVLLRRDRKTANYYAPPQESRKT